MIAVVRRDAQGFQTGFTARQTIDQSNHARTVFFRAVAQIDVDRGLFVGIFGFFMRRERLFQRSRQLALRQNGFPAFHRVAHAHRFADVAARLSHFGQTAFESVLVRRQSVDRFIGFDPRASLPDFKERPRVGFRAFADGGKTFLVQKIRIFSRQVVAVFRPADLFDDGFGIDVFGKRVHARKAPFNRVVHRFDDVAFLVILFGARLVVPPFEHVGDDRVVQNALFGDRLLIGFVNGRIEFGKRRQRPLVPLVFQFLARFDGIGLRVGFLGAGITDDRRDVQFVAVGQVSHAHGLPRVAGFVAQGRNQLVVGRHGT